MTIDDSAINPLIETHSQVYRAVEVHCHGAWATSCHSVVNHWSIFVWIEARLSIVVDSPAQLEVKQNVLFILKNSLTVVVLCTRRCTNKYRENDIIL